MLKIGSKDFLKFKALITTLKKRILKSITSHTYLRSHQRAMMHSPMKNICK